MPQRRSPRLQGAPPGAAADMADGNGPLPPPPLEAGAEASISGLGADANVASAVAAAARAEVERAWAKLQTSVEARSVELVGGS